MNHSGGTTLCLGALAVCVPLAVAAQWWLDRAGPRMLAGGLILPPTMAALALAHAQQVLQLGELLPRSERLAARWGQVLAWIASALLPSTMPTLWALTRSAEEFPPHHAQARSGDPRPYRAAVVFSSLGIPSTLLALALLSQLALYLLAVGALSATTAIAARHLRRGEDRLGTDAPPQSRTVAWGSFVLSFVLLVGCSAAGVLDVWLR